MSGRGAPPSLPPVVVREEVANSVTHGLGLLASLVGAFVLVSLSLERGRRRGTSSVRLSMGLRS